MAPYGKELYFMSGDVGAADAMAVDIAISGDGAVKAGVPHKLFSAAPTGVTAERNTWDVTPDGQRFLINSRQSQDSTTGTPLTVILNW